MHVEAKGLYGIAGWEGLDGEKLLIRNATVTAEGSEGSICMLEALTLEGCDITSPEGAYWDEKAHAVVDVFEDIVTKEVVISKLTAIDAPTAENATVTAFYTMDGRRINTPAPGVNILMMSDGTARKVLITEEH